MMPGARFGTYEIVERIAVDGNGDIYYAWDIERSREVELQILASLVTNAPSLLAGLRRQVALLAGLRHPHVCAVYGTEVGCRECLLGEWVDGQSLSVCIARSPLALEVALAIAAQIADALAAAHERGIVRGGLTPATVGLTKRGEVKAREFGQGRIVGLTGGLAEMVRPPACVKVGYSAPERIREGSAPDAATDIWEFGAVLHELVAGKRAFTGVELSATSRRWCRATSLDGHSRRDFPFSAASSRGVSGVGRHAKAPPHAGRVLRSNQSRLIPRLMFSDVLNIVLNWFGSFRDMLCALPLGQDRSMAPSAATH